MSPRRRPASIERVKHGRTGQMAGHGINIYDTFHLLLCWDLLQFVAGYLIGDTCPVVLKKKLDEEPTFE